MSKGNKKTATQKLTGGSHMSKKIDNIGRMMEMSKIPTKLFLAHSVLSEFCGRKAVRIDWHFHGWRKPIKQGDQFIKGFSGLDKDKQNRFSGFVNELFWECEIDKLKCSIESVLDVEIITEEIALPIDPGSKLPFGRLINRTIDKLSGYFMLDEIKGYDITFPVWGYFDLNNSDVTDEICLNADDMATFMLEKVLEAQGLNPDYSLEIQEREIGGFIDIHHRFMREGEDLLTEVELRKIPCKVRFDMCRSWN